MQKIISICIIQMKKKNKSKTDQIFSLKNIFVNQRICSLNGEVPRRVLRMKHQKPS